MLAQVGNKLLQTRESTEARRSHMRFAEGLDYHRQFLDRHLPDGLIGDVGCGYGRIAAYYESPKRRFVSVDNDTQLIETLAELLPDHDFRVGDAIALPLEALSLDAYIGLGIFELDGARGMRAFDEANRVLKPGGLLYVTVPYLNVPRRLGLKARWRGDELPSFSATEMAKLLNGFDILIARPSSIAHGLGPFKRLASLFPKTLEAEIGLGYSLVGWALRPFANSLLIVARKR